MSDILPLAYFAGWPMAFADELKAMREKAGLTQQQAAERAGLPLRSYQNWEGGARRPRPDAVLPLAKVLGVDAGEILAAMGRSDPAKPRRRGQSIPLIGTVGAGRAEDDAFPEGSMLEVHALYPGDCFAYRAKGDSMLESHICNGDYVVIRRTPEPKAGDKVVAWLADQNGHVVKTLRGTPSRRKLESFTGGGYWHHWLTDADRVYGTLVGVIRKLP